MSRRTDRRPIQVVPLDPAPLEPRIRMVDPAPMAHPVAQSLDSLGRMPPRTAITLILSSTVVAGGTVVAVLGLVGLVAMTLAAIVGMVSIGAMGLAVVALVLGGHKAK